MIKSFVVLCSLMFVACAIALLDPPGTTGGSGNSAVLSAGQSNQVVSIVTSHVTGVVGITNGAVYPIDFRNGLVVTFPNGYWVYDTDPTSGFFRFAAQGDTGTNIFDIGNNGHITAKYFDGDISGSSNYPASAISGSPTIPTSVAGDVGVPASGISNLVVAPWPTSPSAPFTNIPYAMIPYWTNNHIIHYKIDYTNAYQPVVP